MRDPDTGNSRGFGFVSYDSFEASDAAIEAMNGQFLCNRPISAGTPASTYLGTVAPVHNLSDSSQASDLSSQPPLYPYPCNSHPPAEGTVLSS